ncbi:uncharacterized protein LOC144092353 isoform X2 [Stigmatopora argus]
MNNRSEPIAFVSRGASVSSFHLFSTKMQLFLCAQNTCTPEVTGEQTGPEQGFPCMTRTPTPLRLQERRLGQFKTLVCLQGIFLASCPPEDVASLHFGEWWQLEKRLATINSTSM